MRLNYKLLWVEDETDWVETYKDIFRDFLFDLGFKLDVKWFARAPERDVLDSLPLDGYHLILMDYNLGQGRTGKELIEEIRKRGAVTEVVFYTADENTYSEIQKLPFEGVYWASRDGDAFEPRIKKIIELTIKRVMDLSAMRGLAIAEIADIDHMMNQVIENYHIRLNDDKSRGFRKKIYDKMKDSADSSLKSITNKEADCLNRIELILEDSRLFDSNKRWRTVSDIARNCCKDDSCIQLLQNFEAVLKQRNDLAHGHTVQIDAIDKVVGRNGEYTAEDALRIRKELLAHRDNFESILEHVPKE